MRILALLLHLALLTVCVAQNSVAPKLPADVPINRDAGRGSLLIVPIKLEGGEEVPFIVDTGASSTSFDKSIETKLGNPIGTANVQHWGVTKSEKVYPMPKLYLGGVPLMAGDHAITVSIDLPQLSSSVPIKGILGFDCLRHYCIQLDFAAGKMRFLESGNLDKKTLGKAFPIVPLNSNDDRPAIAQNLLGLQGPHSLIDTGYDNDGWLMPKYFQQWTNHDIRPAGGESRFPSGMLGAQAYPIISLDMKGVESDGIGLRFLARHLVTLDFPNRTMYLRLQSAFPLTNPNFKMTRLPTLDNVANDIITEDADAATRDLGKLEHGNVTDLEKSVARHLVATLSSQPEQSPDEVPLKIKKAALGDLRPESATVGWLKPALNRVPLNAEVPSPLLDSGKVFRTGLFAHAPSRYVFNLDGRWKSLRGEAGLHTAFQPYAAGVVFVIKADGIIIFQSPIVRGSTRVHYRLDVSGVTTLDLVVYKAAEQNGGNWALWLDPTLSR